MVVREQWEIKWIQWIAVQENWSTVVSSADTVNIVWGWTVTDVWGVATINIPYWVVWYREDVPAGSASYTFVHSPATENSFLVFTDSGTLMYLWIDYTYDVATETITFLSLEANEAAYIWVAHATVSWGNVWDMVKAVYDPNNVQKNVYDYNYFINTPTIPAAQIQSDRDQADNTQVDFIKNKPTIPDISNLVVWPATAVDNNIVVFDWATGKLIKDSWLNIQTTNSVPVWASICDVYYNNGTIYLYINAVRDNIILES